jgi:carbon-monoxide dehydrogenase large subunit
VEDCGNIVNPKLVEGQVHGGVAQGIGQALYEGVVYDQQTGQMSTSSLMQYAFPTAEMLPPIDTDHTVTPTTLNPLGAKGVGEAGAVGAPAAVVNGIVDALAPFGVRHIDTPVTAEKVWRALEDARRGAH